MAHAMTTSQRRSQFRKRAKVSGKELARTARRRRGAAPLDVDGFVESVEQYVEARTELGDFE